MSKYTKHIGYNGEMLAYIWTAGMKIDSYLPCFSDMSEPIFWVIFFDISEVKNKNVCG